MGGSTALTTFFAFDGEQKRSMILPIRNAFRDVSHTAAYPTSNPSKPLTANTECTVAGSARKRHWRKLASRTNVIGMSRDTVLHKLSKSASKDGSMSMPKPRGARGARMELRVETANAARWLERGARAIRFALP